MGAAREPRQASPAEAGRWARRLAGLALGATLVATPLLFDPTSRDAFRLPKALFVESAALLSLFLLAVGWSLRREERESWVDWRRAPALRAIGPFVAVATLVSLASPHGEHVWRSLAGLLIGALAIWGWSVGFGRAELARWLDWLTPPALLLATVAILQFHDLFQPFEFATLARGSRLAITSFAGNAGDLGAFLVLPALVAQRWLAERGWRFWPAITFAASFYGIAVSQTFAAALALAVGSAILWWRLLPGRRRVLAAIAPVAVLLLALAVSTPFRQRALAKAQELSRGDWNAVLTGRLDGWRAGIWMFSEHPVAGVGLGCYRAEFVPAKRQLLIRGVKFYPEQANVMFANAHSEPIEVGAELGLLGLLALAWAVGGTVRRLKTFPAAEVSRSAAADRGFARGALAAVAVLALVSFPFRIAIVSSQILVLLAWLYSEPEKSA